MVSSSYNPVGAKAEKVDGGVMLSGRWGWSSGCLHCNWVLLGGVIPEEGYRTFLVPAKDYRIDDTWLTMGLQGTGSNDIVIDTPVFVPDHMSHKQMDGFNAVHHQPPGVYDLPWAQAFVRVVNTSAIGAVRHALALMRDRVGLGTTHMTKSATDPDVLDRIARVANLADEAAAVMVRAYDEMEADWEARAAGSRTLSLSGEPGRRPLHRSDGPVDGHRRGPFGVHRQCVSGFVARRAHGPRARGEQSGRLCANYATMLMGGQNADYFI